jgi:hypothetical protein
MRGSDIDWGLVRRLLGKHAVVAGRDRTAHLKAMHAPCGVVW